MATPTYTQSTVNASDPLNLPCAYHPYVITATPIHGQRRLRLAGLVLPPVESTWVTIL